MQHTAGLTELQRLHTESTESGSTATKPDVVATFGNASIPCCTYGHTTVSWRRPACSTASVRACCSQTVTLSPATACRTCHSSPRLQRATRSSKSSRSRRNAKRVTTAVTQRGMSTGVVR